MVATKMWKSLSLASVCFVWSGLLFAYKHGSATQRSAWRRTCFLCRFRKAHSMVTKTQLFLLSGDYSNHYIICIPFLPLNHFKTGPLNCIYQFKLLMKQLINILSCYMWANQVYSFFKPLKKKKNITLQQHNKRFIGIISSKIGP